MQWQYQRLCREVQHNRASIESHALTLTLSRFAVEGILSVQRLSPSPLYREAGEG
jgi:hypothetical protein